MVQFCESCWKEFQFFESYYKKRFNSWSHFFFWEKGSILWVIFFKDSILWGISRKKFYSLSHIFWKNSVYFESYFKEGSILWVKLEKSSILWVVLKKKVQFFESYWKKVRFLKVKIFDPKRLKSLSHEKKVKFFESHEKVRKCWISQNEPYFQKGSILKVIFILWKEKGFDSLRHIWQKMVQFCESCFKRVQFFKSYWKKGANSLSHLFQKRFISVTHIAKKDIQFFESYWQKFNSVSHIEKGS